jgi:hypothetical protein
LTITVTVLSGADAQERVRRERGAVAVAPCRLSAASRRDAERQSRRRSGASTFRKRRGGGERLTMRIGSSCFPSGAALRRFLDRARMRTYVAQRQRLPAIAASMSASVGLLVFGEQRGRRHDLPDWQVAALRHVELLPRRLQRLPSFVFSPSMVVTRRPA